MTIAQQIIESARHAYEIRNTIHDANIHTINARSIWNKEDLIDVYEFKDGSKLQVRFSWEPKVCLGIKIEWDNEEGTGLINVKKFNGKR